MQKESTEAAGTYGSPMWSNWKIAGARGGASLAGSEPASSPRAKLPTRINWAPKTEMQPRDREPSSESDQEINPARLSRPRRLNRKIIPSRVSRDWRSPGGAQGSASPGQETGASSTRVDLPCQPRRCRLRMLRSARSLLVPPLRSSSSAPLPFAL